MLNFWLTFAFIEGICRKQSGNPMVSRGGVRKSGTPEHPGPWSLHLRSPKLSPPSGPCCRLWQRPPLLLVSIVFAFQNSSCPKETVMMELMRRNIVRQIFGVVFLFIFVHQLFFVCSPCLTSSCSSWKWLTVSLKSLIHTTFVTGNDISSGSILIVLLSLHPFTNTFIQALFFYTCFWFVTCVTFTHIHCPMNTSGVTQGSVSSPKIFWHADWSRHGLNYFQQLPIRWPALPPEPQPPTGCCVNMILFLVDFCTFGRKRFWIILIRAG